jgi:antitoxin VapB
MELPESVTEVEITKVGDSRMISPVGKTWDYFFNSPRAAPDFMLDRDQPPEQERDF